MNPFRNESSGVCFFSSSFLGSVSAVQREEEAVYPRQEQSQRDSGESGLGHREAAVQKEEGTGGEGGRERARERVRCFSQTDVCLYDLEISS